MRKMIFINLSPRTKGTSVTLLRMCQAYMDGRGHATELIHLYPSLNHMDNLFKAVSSADTLIFGGPCYVNTYPADTIVLLEALYAHKELMHGQSVYGIIQGGMPYAHTHESGLSLLEIFCKRSNLPYKGGFVMGLGAMLDGQPLTKLPNSKSVLRLLDIFFSHIERDELSPREVYEKAQFKVPRFVYSFMCKRVNKKMDKDLRDRGIDINQKSPYLT